MSDDDQLLAAVHALLIELLDGAPEGGAYILNPGDRGLLRSLAALSASAASVVPPGRSSSIAAHVDHLRYGLSLLNLWFEGDPNPFKDADYSASWQRTDVTEAEWTSRRAELAEEARKWAEALTHSRPLNSVERRGVVSSVAHLSYHIGAIRQIDRTIVGPKAKD